MFPAVTLSWITIERLLIVLIWIKGSVQRISRFNAPKIFCVYLYELSCVLTRELE